MAAGDFNVDARYSVMGNRRVFTGDAEIDGTMRAFDIFPAGYIHSMQVHGFDEAGAVVVQPNYNASGTADNGNCAMRSMIVPVQTYFWRAEVTI